MISIERTLNIGFIFLSVVLPSISQRDVCNINHRLDALFILFHSEMSSVSFIFLREELIDCE